jgi:hypothetical protein
MPRRSVLIPLSRDHHRDLVHARRLQAAARNTPPEPVAAARAFIAFFGMRMVTHFSPRRGTVFPLLVDADGEDRALLVQALLDHQRLHALAAHLTDELDADAVTSKLLGNTGSLLESHVRLEERRLSPCRETRRRPARRGRPELLADSPVFDFLAGEDEGPLWGTASGDLDVTYSRGIQAPPHRST